MCDISSCIWSLSVRANAAMCPFVHQVAWYVQKYLITYVLVSLLLSYIIVHYHILSYNILITIMQLSASEIFEHTKLGRFRSIQVRTKAALYLRHVSAHTKALVEVSNLSLRMERYSSSVPQTCLSTYESTCECERYVVTHPTFDIKYVDHESPT